MQKQSVWVLRTLCLAAIFLGSGWVATIGGWAFWLLVVAHLVEFLVHLPLFKRAGGSMLHHFVQTMIYGLFHWTPIKEGFAAQDAAP